jgi:cytochrome-b5 reductase
MNHTVTIVMTEFVTHDVKRFIVSKPEGYSYKPGQGVELAVNQPGWTEQGRPFTPTSLPDDLILEFTIKAYPEHNGVTKQLHQLTAGDELLLSEPFGTITYQGPGTFIAGGAGVTPFIAILRYIAGNNKLDNHIDKHGLIFSNKTPADVICEKEFRHYMRERCILTCTQESSPGYDNRRIDLAFLKDNISDVNQHFYVCGPPAFVDHVNGALKELGAHPDTLVFEQ